MASMCVPAVAPHALASAASLSLGGRFATLGERIAATGGAEAEGNVLSPVLAAAVEAWQEVARQTANAAIERDWRWRDATADLRWAYFQTYQDLLALADTIGAARLAAGRAQTLAQRALSRYHTAYRELGSLLARVSESEFDRAPAAGEWPLRTVLGHVMQTDAGFLTITDWALQRRRAGDDRPLAAPDDRFGPRPETDAGGAMEVVLVRFAGLHERVLRTLSGATDAELTAPIGFWYSAEVAFQLHRFDAHLREHTIQVEKVLEAIQAPASDAWRTLRLIYRALGEAEGAALGAEALAEAPAAEAAAEIRARGDELLALLRAGG
jgi:DinB family protein